MDILFRLSVAFFAILVLFSAVVLIVHDFYNLNCSTEYTHFNNNTSANNNGTSNNYIKNNTTIKLINTTVSSSIIFTTFNQIKYKDERVKMEFDYPDDMKSIKGLQIYTFVIALLTNFVIIWPVLLLCTLPLVFRKDLGDDVFQHYLNVVPAFIFLLLLIPSIYMLATTPSLIDKYNNSFYCYYNLLTITKVIRKE